MLTYGLSNFLARRMVIDFTMNPELSKELSDSGAQLNIDFETWLKLITLCLAPLIVHIVSGVLPPTVLHTNEPRWHDKITHYNPTSILWRYFAIFDRRVRHETWNPENMAAANAMFWTELGWDGSESMIADPSVELIRAPNHDRIRFFSATCAKTVTIIYQGIEALFLLLGGLGMRSSYGDSFAFDSLFFPLAAIGLMRIPGALWMTEDYLYADHNERLLHTNRDRNMTFPEPQHPGFHKSQKSNTLTAAMSMLHPANSWRGRMVRCLFITPVALFVILNVYYLLHNGGFHKTYTVTQFFATVYYLTFLSISSISIIVFFLQGQSTTTTIPCINSNWYKVYTLFLFVTAIALVVVTGCETKLTYCGKFTTIPVDWTHKMQDGSCMYVWDALCSGNTKKVGSPGPHTCEVDIWLR